MKKTAILDQLKQLAYQTQKKAYAPYSGFSVGAAIEDASGNLFSGCNIENSSYGGTVCAERVAIWNGISAGIKLPIKTVVVVNSTEDKWPPCGLCRQVMAEFCNDKTQIYFGNNEKDFRKTSFKKLLPEAFSKKFLKR